MDGVDGTSIWHLFTSYLANRRPGCSRLFCAGKPSFIPFSGPPELAKRSRIGCASPTSAWYDQNGHISSVLGEILVVPFALWVFLKPRSMRFWEALIRVKRTSGSCVTAPSLQQPLTCDLFMSYLAVRRTDRSHPFCAGKPSFTPFFGLPELAKRPRIGCASPSSAWYDQDEHVLSVLSEIFVATFVLWFVLKLRSMRFWEALIRIKRTSGSCITASSLQQPFPHSYCHKLLASDVLWPVLNVGFVPFRRTYLRR